MNWGVKIEKFLSTMESEYFRQLLVDGLINTIKVAVQGTTDKSWHLKCEHISKQYTTNLDDVILVK